MKRVPMILAALMVVLTISTTVLAESRGTSEMSIFSAGPLVASSGQLVTPQTDRRDARDASFMKSLGTFGGSGHSTVLAWDKRDARDNRLFENFGDKGLAGSGNSVLVCCLK
jgi:hypothetical protein